MVLAHSKHLMTNMLCFHCSRTSYLEAGALYSLLVCMRYIITFQWVFYIHCIYDEVNYIILSTLHRLVGLLQWVCTEADGFYDCVRPQLSNRQ